MAVRVLVVTSRTAFAEALSVALRASDLDYVGAPRAAEAVRTIKEELPGAVIVDLLSASGALESITDAVRDAPHGADVPVIFCGDGKQAIKSTTDSLIAGGDGYFQLPTETQRVVAKIATYVGCQLPELPATLVLPDASADAGADDSASTPPSELADTTVPVLTPRPVTILEEASSQAFEEATDSLALQAVEAAIAAARTRSGEGATLKDGAVEAAREAELEREAQAAREAQSAHEAQAAREAQSAHEAAELAVAEEQRRVAEEQRRVADEQRQAAEEQLRGAETRRAQAERDAAEAERRAVVRQAELEARQAELEARQAELTRKSAQATAELRALDEQRVLAEQTARRAEEEAADRELRERTRLEELEQRRELAEQQTQRALEAAAEQEREGERKIAELTAAEERERERLDELERERVRREADLERAQIARREREGEERARLEELEAERHRQEERARRSADEQHLREQQELEHLQAIEEERVRREAELRDTLEQRQRDILDEEERLAELKRTLQVATEREHTRAEERLRLEADAETRLAEARRQREQLEQEAALELEKLRHLRSEEELARRELDEKRARARLAFQTGRLDALAPGDRAAGTDVGSRMRPTSDAEGQVVGGPLLPQLTIDAAPPPPPQMVPLEPPAGRFADGELPSVLWACASLKVTGALDITLDDGRVRSLFLEDGEPVLISSTLPVDRPEEGLLRAGLVTAARYNELRAGPLRSPRRTAGALVADGVLKPEELFPAVRGVLTEQVLSLLEHDAGAFSYRDALAHAGDRVRLEHGMDALLAEGIRRKFDERRLWLVLGGPSSLVAPDDRAREMPPLSPEEKMVLVRLDGTRALEDVIVESGIAPQVILRAALIAISCGAARMLARGVPADPAERQVQRERSVAIDKARVLDRLHMARNGDYYSFLGVDVHAAPFEVQRAAERLRQRFDPQRYPDPAFAELQAALQEIVEVTYDAEAVLGDESLSEGYRKHLLGGAPRLHRRRA